MIFLAYVSTTSCSYSHEELLEIHRRFREESLEKGLTGVQAYRGNRFLHILEGKRDDVLETFEGIRHDSRHYNLTLIGAGPLLQRNFREPKTCFDCMECMLKADEGLCNFETPCYSPDNKHISMVLLRSFVELDTHLKQIDAMTLS